MGPKSPLERLRAPVRYTSSSSLSGMEKVSPLSSAGTMISPNSVVSDIDKPLPPPPAHRSPRKSSSVYSLQLEHARARRAEIRDNTLPHYDARPLPSRAYTARSEEKEAQRPKYERSAGSESKSDPVLKAEAMYGNGAEGSSGHLEGRAMRTNTTTPSPGQYTTMSSRSPAQDRTMEYFENEDPFGDPREHGVDVRRTGLDVRLRRTGLDVRLRRTSQVPPHLKAEKSEFYESYLPAAMSPRITDVIDHSLVPTPLLVEAVNTGPPRSRISEPEEDSRPSTSSQFSSDSSHSSITSIIGSYLSKSRWNQTKKKIKISKNRRKSSSSATAKGRKSSRSSSTLSRLSTSFSATRSRLGSVASNRRKSFSKGVDTVYDTLARFSLAPKAVPPLPRIHPTKRGLPKEKRSPAIPITPYQKYGPKAWEMEKAAKSPKKPKFGIRQRLKKSESVKQSSSKGIQYEQLTYSALLDHPKVTRQASSIAKGNRHTVTSYGSGISTDADRQFEKPSRKTKADRRRDELKKKIVVVGLGEGRPTSDGPWI